MKDLADQGWMRFFHNVAVMEKATSVFVAEKTDNDPQTKEMQKEENPRKESTSRGCGSAQTPSFLSTGPRLLGSWQLE